MFFSQLSFVRPRDLLVCFSSRNPSLTKISTAGFALSARWSRADEVWRLAGRWCVFLDAVMTSSFPAVAIRAIAASTSTILDNCQVVDSRRLNWVCSVTGCVTWYLLISLVKRRFSHFSYGWTLLALERPCFFFFFLRKTTCDFPVVIMVYDHSYSIQMNELIQYRRSISQC